MMTKKEQREKIVTVGLAREDLCKTFHLLKLEGLTIDVVYSRTNEAVRTEKTSYTYTHELLSIWCSMCIRIDFH